MKIRKDDLVTSIEVSLKISQIFWVDLKPCILSGSSMKFEGNICFFSRFYFESNLILERIKICFSDLFSEMIFKGKEKSDLLKQCKQNRQTKQNLWRHFKLKQ